MPAARGINLSSASGVSDEDFLFCDMSMAKGYALVHAIAEQSGAKCVWANEVMDSQESVMEQAREIIRRNTHG